MCSMHECLLVCVYEKQEDCVCLCVSDKNNMHKCLFLCLTRCYQLAVPNHATTTNLSCLDEYRYPPRIHNVPGNPDSP